MTNMAIDIEGLTYRYPDGTAALEGATLSVAPGESLGLIGQNGAGKSTLLLHMNGILRGEGRARVLDMDVADENIMAIRRRVGLVFQDPDNQLFMPTVFEDVAFGPLNMGWDESRVRTSVDGALVAVDMLAAAHRSSHHLSFGEKKRIAVATVLAMSPDVIVLDEPSSNLDPRHRRELIDFLKTLPQTKVIAAHDLGLVHECCTRVAVMHAGRIVACGETSRILDDAELLQRYGLK